MQFNLNTTIKAYQKLSPSLLVNYVQEAPTDGKVYGRKDRQWVKLYPDNIMVLYGTTKYSTISLDMMESFKVVNNLDYKDQTFNLKLETLDDGSCEGEYIWFCASVPISSIIQTNVGLPIDYEKQEDTLQLDDNTLIYCYRTSTPLLPDIWQFTITLDACCSEGNN